jgi:hypothetical protein
MNIMIKLPYLLLILLLDVVGCGLASTTIIIRRSVFCTSRRIVVSEGGKERSGATKDCETIPFWESAGAMVGAKNEKFFPRLIGCLFGKRSHARIGLFLSPFEFCA